MSYKFYKIIIYIFLFFQMSIAFAANHYDDIQDTIELGRKTQEKTLRNIAKDGNKLSSQNQNNNLPKYVFISFSISKPALEELIKQAKLENFIPVIRGFKDGSYKKTVEAFSQINKKAEYGIIIDPEVFKEFNIKVVPTFVKVTEKAKQCLPNTTCPPRTHNKLSGNITPKYASEQLTKIEGIND